MLLYICSVMSRLALAHRTELAAQVFVGVVSSGGGDAALARGETEGDTRGETEGDTRGDGGFVASRWRLCAAATVSGGRAPSVSSAFRVAAVSVGACADAAAPSPHDLAASASAPRVATAPASIEAAEASTWVPASGMMMRAERSGSSATVEHFFALFDLNSSNRTGRSPLDLS